MPNNKQEKMQQIPVGIDDMALYVPQLYLPIETLAQERNLEYAKLNKGLGLTSMAILDANEDAATMAANAVAEIIDRNGLIPNAIGRIYLGTESALDGAKPTATYVLEMLRQKYSAKYGEDCFRNCDVVDLTFACIGGVDALHNTLDWVRGKSDRIGIVVTSDFAKYELASSGEYTQGAGAVAMLVKQHPRLLAIGDTVGVGCKGVHDFFKPKRKIEKAQVVKEVLKAAGIDDGDMETILKNLHANALTFNGLLDDNDTTIPVTKETPTFDGQYSNWCYQQRIREAYQHFRAQSEGLDEVNLLERWARIIFHLPYAFHGKRIFSEIFMLELQAANQWSDFVDKNDLKEPMKEDFASPGDHETAYESFLRKITKTADYRAYVAEKMEKAQRASSLVGNMYACSVFLALMSTLASDHDENANITGKTFGFFSYGSGSKSKVFEGTVQSGWKEVVQHFDLFERLKNRTAIDYATYERLHRGQQKTPILDSNQQFTLNRIGDKGVRDGARYYLAH